MKLILPSLFLIFCTLTDTYSQITASFYTNSSGSKFAVGYNINERFWTDLRIYSDTSIDNITPEIVINHNIVTKTSYDVYLGAGAILNNINGVVIPIGIGIKPFENLKDLSFNIEFNPIYEFDLDNLFVRGFLGIRYKLN
ncbi:hypothetical protein P700755_002227 [Psychroflexus torquis ATCC 700755]|uniref:Uncharacterized protein n=1 Tax=Psychroflexus torquis (strain ATCC 700755 / CIP 106069 / ACAM 623) TaxID=313595 RepID=K4IIV4_PSYTT|nr:hypothetical protein [Psychroflexus torquis]AFU69016.1 hypothetical protein P700755_002227 [Psychroflexus torquis ATCC 700755]